MKLDVLGFLLAFKGFNNRSHICQEEQEKGVWTLAVINSFACSQARYCIKKVNHDLSSLKS